MTASSVAVVTGGGTHLGRAIATLLASRGHRVVIAARDHARSTAVAAEIASEFGECTALRCDVGDEASVRALFEQVEATLGRVAILVAGAGASLTTSGFTEAALAEVEATFRVNLIGSYLCAREAARSMMTSGGVIVLISSIHGIVGSDHRLYDGIESFTPSGPAYHASKGGVIQLTRSLAATLAPSGIRVNCVSPGFVPNERAPDELVDRYARRTPLGRVGTPEDIAAAVGFLASEDASWITGQNLVVDGGWTVW